MNLVSQVFGIVMAIGGFVLAFVRRDELSHSIPLMVFSGGMILIGAFLLTPDKLKGAVDELAQFVPWRKKD